MLMPFFSITAGGLPDYSLDFERSSSQYLNMSDANFGAFDRAKFAISVWIKRESLADSHAIMSQYNTAGNRAFRMFFNNSNKLIIQTSQDGTAINGNLTTTATYTSTANWYHILFHYDSANATAGDRMKLWVDGVEVTVFDTDTNPTAAIFDSGGNVLVGYEQALSAYFDGLIYQLGFFSGTLPTIGQVYDAGAPIDISGLAGLYAYLNAAGNSVVADDVLSADWTNNNTVITSTTKP